MPKHYKEMMDEIINKCVDEDAPANAVGSGANVALPPSHEPGVKKKKKDDFVSFKKRMTESDDNNNVVLKGVLDKIDKLEEAVDTASGIEKQELVFEVEDKEYKSFKDKYAKDV